MLTLKEAKVPKLIQAQQLALSELLENKDGLNALYQELENNVERMEQDVLRMLLMTRDQESELIYKKSRAEGARFLLYSLGLIINPPKHKSKK